MSRGLTPAFQQMGGIRMPQGRDGAAHFGDTGSLCGFAEGALDTGATHRGSGRRPLEVIAPGGGQEPGGVTMGFPGGAEQCQGIGGQGDVPVFGALATMDMDLEALTIDVGDVKGQGFMEPEAQARDGGKVDLVVQGGGRLQEPRDLLHTEDGRETVSGLRTQACKGVPVAFEDVLREEADAAVADAHRGWGETVDIFAVQEVSLELLFGEAVRGLMVELSQQTDCPDIGCLRPFTFATELEGCDHLLT